MSNILLGLEYITQDPFFHQAMGWVVACSIFIGATLYDGNLKSWGKAFITILTYAGLIYMITVSRINFFDVGHSMTKGATYAGMATLFAVTVAYLIGLLIGVLITYHIYRKSHATNTSK